MAETWGSTATAPAGFGRDRAIAEFATKKSPEEINPLGAKSSRKKGDETTIIRYVLYLQ